MGTHCLRVDNHLLTMVFLVGSLSIFISQPGLAKLYNCEKNGTVVISSEPCQKRSKSQAKNVYKQQTCFLEDRKTLEQSLVSNPSRRQLKRSRVIWCERKGQSPQRVRKSPAKVTEDHSKRKRPSSPSKHKQTGGHHLPKRAAAFKDYVAKAAELYDLPEALLWAFMKVESDFIPTAVSRVGAQGLMQLMPFTSKDMGVQDPFNPEQNIFGAAKLINILMKRFNKELPLVISAYHAGGGAVTKKEGIPYTQTSQYMTSVLNAYYRYMESPPYVKKAKKIE